MSELNTLTISEARDRLRSGEITATELTAACLKQVEAAGALNAFVHHSPEIAMDQAKAAEARLQGSEEALAIAIGLMGVCGVGLAGLVGYDS